MYEVTKYIQRKITNSRKVLVHHHSVSPNERQEDGHSFQNIIDQAESGDCESGSKSGHQDHQDYLASIEQVS